MKNPALTMLFLLLAACGGAGPSTESAPETWYVRDAESVDALLKSKSPKTLERARSLHERLAALPASEGSGAVGQALGIARYAEFKVLADRGSEAEAYAVLQRQESHTPLLPPDREAWMYETGIKLALSLSKPPTEVLSHGEKCWRLGAATGSTPPQCAQTVCAILQTMGRADLNIEFAWRLFATGRDNDDFSMMELGALFLADNYEAKSDKKVQAKLIEVRDVLEAEAPSAEVLHRVKEALFGQAN